LIAGRDDLVNSYLEAIERELSWLGKPHEVDTLFLGGGTPSHLKPDALSRLFSIVTDSFPLADGCEFSVEANPADVNPPRMDVFARFGVTRVSLGAQSFDSKKLELLERDHSAHTITQAVQLTRNAGCSVSLDLIFAVPGEELTDWESDLDEALRLTPDHISTYGLTFGEGTSFSSRLQRGELAEKDESVQADMYELAIDKLTASGFEHYEVSNFAQPGHRCRHNETYWTGHGYYAVGPGAARFINGRRETNHRSVTTYLNRVLNNESPVAERERLSPEDSARERLVFGLRRLQGVDLLQFADQTDFEVQQLVGASLERFCDLGMLEIVDSQLRLTRQGLLVSDSIWPEFLNPEGSETGEL